MTLTLSDRCAISACSPDSRFSTLTDTSSSGDSNYNGLTVCVTRHSANLTVQGNYTAMIMLLTFPKCLVSIFRKGLPNTFLRSKTATSSCLVQRNSSKETRLVLIVSALQRGAIVIVLVVLAILVSCRGPP